MIPGATTVMATRHTYPAEAAARSSKTSRVLPEAAVDDDTVIMEDVCEI